MCSLENLISEIAETAPVSGTHTPQSEYTLTNRRRRGRRRNKKNMKMKIWSIEIKLFIFGIFFHVKFSVLISFAANCGVAHAKPISPLNQHIHTNRDKEREWKGKRVKDRESREEKQDTCLLKSVKHHEERKENRMENEQRDKKNGERSKQSDRHQKKRETWKRMDQIDHTVCHRLCKSMQSYENKWNWNRIRKVIECRLQFIVSMVVPTPLVRCHCTMRALPMQFIIFARWNLRFCCAVLCKIH